MLGFLRILVSCFLLLFFVTSFEHTFLGLNAANAADDLFVRAGLIEINPAVVITDDKNELTIDFSTFDNSIFVRPKVASGSVFAWDKNNSLWIPSDALWTDLLSTRDISRLRFFNISEYTELFFILQDVQTGEIFETEKALVYSHDARVKYVSKVNNNILSWSEPYPILSIRDTSEGARNIFSRLSIGGDIDYKNIFFVIVGAFLVFKYIGNPFKKAEKFDY